MNEDDVAYFYKLVRGYGAFNPHARLTLRANGEDTVIGSPTSWSKWLPHHPTSAHWYTPERLRGLIAAHVGNEHDGGKALTVREFVSQFAGLSSTSKTKAVLESAGLSGAHLHDLVDGDDIDTNAGIRLLQVMKAKSRAVQPAKLGVIGEAHLVSHLVEHEGLATNTVKYAKKAGLVDGLPYVLELAFGVLEEHQAEQRSVFGLNWTPTLKMPVNDLFSLLDEAQVDDFDPVVLAIHLACPRLEFMDRGKSDLSLPDQILDDMEHAVRSATRDFRELKRKADHNRRISERARQEYLKAKRACALTIKEAAYQAMKDAYMKASADNTLPANARQIMYAARPEVLRLTGGKCWGDSSYFTQVLLPGFVETYPELTEGWDVVFDDRGHFAEPHTGERIGLGTLAVRRYVEKWTHNFDGELPGGQEPDFAVPTAGPAHRYKFALFVEKEGFNELFERVRLADRYDLAIMSTKGMSTTASRQLVEHLSNAGVVILVLHDFDKAGFSIVHTLRSDTRRYHYDVTPEVVDLGLRLDDVQTLSLENERVDYGKTDPRENLSVSGATDAECAFLVRGKDNAGWKWYGERVEINAMTSDQLVKWLEGQLREHGVEKVVPDRDVLSAAYRRAVRLSTIRRAIEEAARKARDGHITVPADLHKRVKAYLEENPTASWDEAVASVSVEAAGD